MLTKYVNHVMSKIDLGGLPVILSRKGVIKK